jgi:hypothetical protein
MRPNHIAVSAARRTGGLCLLLFVLFRAGSAMAQSTLINLSALDGVGLTPENIFSYAIQSTAPSGVEALVKGTVRYRQSGLSFSYSFRTTLRPGMNRIEGSAVHPDWSFSSGALRDLFLDYRVMPEGTYEYCVTVTPVGSNGELIAGGEASECLYNRSEDLFLINLLEPDNDAKIYEHYPVFSWVVNYPFAAQLTYRIRVAEMKEGQNTVSAVSRNNPVYTESSLPQTTTTYPVYGTPLKTAQPYAWTVDAYYKGILLGGAEPWKFTIIEDSEMVEVPRDPSYYDVMKLQDRSAIYAVGTLKLKYTSAIKLDSLRFSLATANGKSVKLQLPARVMHYADNLLELDLRDKLQHKGKYIITLTNNDGAAYPIPFIYYNPLFVK